MIVSDIFELHIIDVLERGTPNKECIAIKAHQTLNLGQYGIMLGQYIDNNAARPFKDNLFWFGDGVVGKGDWIFIYTGSGTPRESKAVDNVHNIYTVFWGRPSTLFANSNIVPLLFRVDAVDVPEPPNDVPQLPQLS